MSSSSSHASRPRGPASLPVRASWLQLLLLLLLPIGWGSTSCTPPLPGPSAPSPLLGRPMPPVERAALDGSVFDTAAHRGSVLVVKFFAEYCEPCTRTLPATQRLRQSYPDIVVLGIGEDELRSTVEAIVARYGLTFPVIHDSANVIAGRFRVTEMPIAFVVDKAGMIRWVATERQSHADLERAVIALR